MPAGNSRTLLRLAAALAAAPFLSGAVLSRGWGALADVPTLVFPCLWLYLALEGRIALQALSDGQVFVLGSAFSFLYEGLFTKRMQDGLSVSGLDWAAVLGGPLEWGMAAVLWFHCLQALLPRPGREEPPAAPSFWRTALLVVIPAGAGLVYLWKSAFGHYRVEHFLGPLWPLDDLVLLGAAAWLWRSFRKSLSAKADRKPAWVWAAAGLGVWLLGSGLLAQVCDGFSAPKMLFYTVQTFWLAGLGTFLWVTWRDQVLLGDEPVRRSRPVLAAAGLRIAGSLLLLALFGAIDDPRMSFWSGLLCDWPSKMLFYYAFLTSRLEV